MGTKERGYATQFDVNKLVPAVIAVAGVAIIEIKGAGDPTIGDLISFSQPIGFGMGYLLLENLMKKEPEAALPVSCIKLVVVAMSALAFFELSPLTAVDATDGIAQSVEGLKLPDFTPILQSPVALATIFYTGLITTSLVVPP